MIVRLPSLLDSYTGGDREQEVEADSLPAALEALDERFPGLRFRLIDEQDRIRPHIRIFVGQELVRSLEHPWAGEAVQVVGALSGG